MKEVKEILLSSKTSGASSLLEEIESDEKLINELTKLGIQFEELPFYVNTLFDYKRQKDQCTYCPGNGKCDSEIKGSYMTLIVNDSGKLSYTLGPCPEEIEKARIRTNYVYRDFDESFLSDAPRRTKKKRTLNEAKLMSCATDKDHPWAYITGASGSGKSYQVMKICNDFAANDFKIAYLNYPQRSEEMKSLVMKDNDAFKRMINKINDCTVLVLDDFGDEFKSDYLFDAVLLPLLLERSRKGQITYFVSAYSLKELELAYNAVSKTRVNVRRIMDLIKKKTEAEIVVKPTARMLIN